MFSIRNHLCKKAVVALWLMLSPCITYAEAYAEFALIAGGEELASTFIDDIYAGGGLKFAFGAQHRIGDSPKYELTYTLGYMFDDVSGTNGNAEFDVFVLDALFQLRNGPHRFAFGGSYHINPEYEENIDGFARFRIDFDDALGFTARYSYDFGDVFLVGGVITVMDYEADGESFDANSLGFFVATYF